MYRFLCLLVLVCISLAPSQSFADTIFSGRFFDRSEHVKPWKFHFRLGWSASFGNEEFTLNGIPYLLPSNTPMDKDLLGVNFDLERFITDYVSLSLGVGYEAGKADEITYDNGITTLSTQGKTALFPVDFAINLHPAPYGDIDPYIGIGYSHSFVSSTFDGIDVSASGGPLVRVGFDWLIEKNLSFNFDVKKRILTLDTDYQEFSVDNWKSETELDPLTISAGIGYKF